MRSLLTISALLALTIAVQAQSARGPREDSESTSAGARAGGGGAPPALQMKTSTPADGTFGAGVTLKDATPIKTLYEHPEKFLNKKIRIDGVVTGVCEDMGCWMAIAAEDNPAQTVRIKVEEHGTIMFPMTAMGKHASAEGVFMKLPATGDAKEAAQEEAKGKTPSPFSATYQIKGTGAIVK